MNPKRSDGADISSSTNVQPDEGSGGPSVLKIILAIIGVITAGSVYMMTGGQPVPGLMRNTRASNLDVDTVGANNFTNQNLNNPTNSSHQLNEVRTIPVDINQILEAASYSRDNQRNIMVALSSRDQNCENQTLEEIFADTDEAARATSWVSNLPSVVMRHLNLNSTGINNLIGALVTNPNVTDCVTNVAVDLTTTPEARQQQKKQAAKRQAVHEKLSTRNVKTSCSDVGEPIVGKNRNNKRSFEVQMQACPPVVEDMESEDSGISAHSRSRRDLSRENNDGANGNAVNDQYMPDNENITQIQNLIKEIQRQFCTPNIGLVTDLPAETHAEQSRVGGPPTPSGYTGVTSNPSNVSGETFTPPRAGESFDGGAAADNINATLGEIRRLCPDINITQINAGDSDGLYSLFTLIRGLAGLEISNFTNAIILEANQNVDGTVRDLTPLDNVVQALRNNGMRVVSIDNSWVNDIAGVESTLSLRDILATGAPAYSEAMDHLNSSPPGSHFALMIGGMFLLVPMAMGVVVKGRWARRREHQRARAAAERNQNQARRRDSSAIPLQTVVNTEMLSSDIEKINSQETEVLVPQNTVNTEVEPNIMGGYMPVDIDDLQSIGNLAIERNQNQASRRDSSAIPLQTDVNTEMLSDIEMITQETEVLLPQNTVNTEDEPNIIGGYMPVGIDDIQHIENEAFVKGRNFMEPAWEIRCENHHRKNKKRSAIQSQKSISKQHSKSLSNLKLSNRFQLLEDITGVLPETLEGVPPKTLEDVPPEILEMEETFNAITQTQINSVSPIRRIQSEMNVVKQSSSLQSRRAKSSTFTDVNSEAALPFGIHFSSLKIDGDDETKPLLDTAVVNRQDRVMKLPINVAENWTRNKLRTQNIETKERKKIENTARWDAAVKQKKQKEITKEKQPEKGAQQTLQFEPVTRREQMQRARQREIEFPIRTFTEDYYHQPLDQTFFAELSQSNGARAADDTSRIPLLQLDNSDEEECDKNITTGKLKCSNSGDRKRRDRN